MSDGFMDMLDEANVFFDRLKANNTRAFFEENKAYYTDAIRKPAELMVELMAEELSRLTGDPYTPKLFRIHRDVRFSKDKTPYKTHLHAMWTAPARPGYFFASEPGVLALLMGVPNLSGDRLTAYRKRIDQDGAEIVAEIDRLSLDIRPFTPALKRVPKPYDPDHPQADLLKEKGLVLRMDLWGQVGADGLIKTLRSKAAQLQTLHQLLSEI